MSTTNLAFQLLAASNYIDALGGVSQSYRQALASYEAEAEAKPAVPVADGCQVVHVVMKEDGTIHLKKGDRSTWVGYKSDDRADQEWRAGCISRLLGHSGWDAAAPAAPAQAEAKPAPPFTPEERKALEKWVAAAPAAPAPEHVGESDWPEYIAGLIVTHLGGDVTDERIKPIAGIIQRRMWLAAPAAPAPEPLTASQVHELCDECHLDWHRGWSIDEEPNRFLNLVRLVEAWHGIAATTKETK